MKVFFLTAGGGSREMRDWFFSSPASEKIAFGGFIDSNPALPEVVADPGAFKPGEGYVAATVGNPGLRRKLTSLIGRENFIGIHHSDAIVSSTSSIGHGCVITPLAFVNANSDVGAFAYLNIGSIVAHDCVIGEFVTLGPYAQCLGRSRIGPDTEIGAGVILLPGVTVGSGCVVGAGTIVTKDIPDNMVVRSRHELVMRAK